MAKCGKKGVEEPLGAVLTKGSHDQPVKVTILRHLKQPSSGHVQYLRGETAAAIVQGGVYYI